MDGRDGMGRLEQARLIVILEGESTPLSPSLQLAAKNVYSTPNTHAHAHTYTTHHHCTTTTMPTALDSLKQYTTVVS